MLRGGRVRDETVVVIIVNCIIIIIIFIIIDVESSLIPLHLTVQRQNYILLILKEMSKEEMEKSRFGKDKILKKCSRDYFKKGFQV